MPGFDNLNAGLCDSCRHQRVVPNRRGSRFSLCERSRHDPVYPRYPRLPVSSCAGYEQRGEMDSMAGPQNTDQVDS